MNLFDLLNMEGSLESKLSRMKRASDTQFTGEILMSMLAKLVAKEIISIDDGLDIMLSPISDMGSLSENIRTIMRPEMIRMMEDQKKRDKERQEKQDAKPTDGA